MVGKIILDAFLVVLFGIGLLILFGLLNELFIYLFTKILGEKSYKVQIVTGAIGVPVHEAGHALFCLIFGHKITEIKLYTPNPQNGVMGYVNHRYNPKNFYHVIGNFFIGVGPLILGLGVLIGLFALLANQSFVSIATNVRDLTSGDVSFLAALKAVGYAIKEMFSFSNLTSVLWWIFFIIGCPIALHMNLSPADVKGSWQGLLFTVGVLFVVSIIIGVIKLSALEAFTHAMFAFALYQIAFAQMAIVAFAVMLIIALIARLIRNKKDKRSAY